MGFDLKDSLGMLGMLANAGFDASTAGTSTKILCLRWLPSHLSYLKIRSKCQECRRFHKGIRSVI